MAYIEELRELVDAYVWLSANVEAPVWWKSPIYKDVLGKSEERYEEICSYTPLHFAPNMLEVLQSPTPPSVEFFRALPDPTVGKKAKKIWAIYAVLMEKVGQRPRVYFGSGTNRQRGVKVRLATYDNGTHVPRLVQCALDQGFTISHRGLLCWGDLPPTTLAPIVATRFLALEATFTFMFFARVETIMDEDWTWFMPWKRHQVEWDPLCTHTAFNEKPRDTELSEEALEAAQTARELHIRKRSLFNSKRADAKARAEDLKGFLARKLRIHMRWADKNWDKVLDMAAGTRARAKASRRFFCSICDMASATNYALNKHNDTIAHKKQVKIAAGEAEEPLSAEAAQRKARYEGHKKIRRFRCTVCDKGYITQAHLSTHYNSQVHKRKRDEQAKLKQENEKQEKLKA